MNDRFEKIAVLGAGVMGSGIAAHLAGAGCKVLLLDIVPKDAPAGDRKARNAIVDGAVAAALKSRPAVFHDPDDLRRIETGNFEDDIEKIGECDWIIEVVKEDLKIKKIVFDQVEKCRKPGTPVASNTSGLSIAAMGEGRSEDFRKHLLVTHFFNPVRYMKLLELVPGPDCDPAVVEKIANFGATVLGKGIVMGKDTPNFVANRIGVYGMMRTMQVMEEMELSIDAVDSVFGPAMGRPRSAVFRTADIVGLDTFIHVANNCYDSLLEDEARDIFKVPGWMQWLVDQGFLGAKSKKGFYQKQGKEILSFDWRSKEYKPQEKVRFDSLGAARGEDDLAKKVKGLVNADDPAGQFAWKVLSASLAYSANRVGEIADDLFNIDCAMRWGFNWEQGPFEAWDAIGVRESVERMKADGLAIAPWVEEFLAAGHESFYQWQDGVLRVWDPGSKIYEPHVPRPGVVQLRSVRDRAEKPIFDKLGCQVHDLGDGVACVEFLTKMNIVDADPLEGIEAALNWAEAQGVGVVIGNEGKTAFSAGANLMLVFMMAQNKDWEGLDKMVKSFQDINLRMRYSPVPVVAAPHGLTLGGGAEIVLHADAVQAAMETYIGLVEVGVGLLPGAGGTKEMALRMANAIPAGVNALALPFLQKAFENIALARVATGAREARRLGFLRDSDGISLGSESLIGDAKKRVLALAGLGYVPPLPAQAVLPGRDGAAVFEFVLEDFKGKHMASEHDVLIGKKIVHVLTGGDTDGRSPVSEQALLDLEREAFLSLVGEEKTQARIQHMLMKNKPLRN
ncbi:MAG: 3-hydroxyacyl-CoA dehydrogenase/enoyl-CoA hydratase family protein [Deltaproteobacteria bacterium]|nr:3-hydroxyacyl-CoA dehydrogenase/enoyl-CoA hydratase family protein [Deltaproteobacteria bacterium]